MIPIAIVDDKAYLRESLKHKLSNDVSVLLEASNGEEFLLSLKQSKVLPQLVFMDIEMPFMNGIETVSIASSLYPDIKFVMLTVFDDDDKIFAAIKAGACGYLLKDEDAHMLNQAVKLVIEYEATPMSPSIARKTWQWLSAVPQMPTTTPSNEPTNNAYEILSQREMEVLQHTMEGKDYKCIAEAMFLSPHTIRQHIKNIYRKLHVNNKVEAIRIGIKNKWIG